MTTYKKIKGQNMPRGERTSDRLKPDLVADLCNKIGCTVDSTIYNPNNGTITKKLLQEVCRHQGIANYSSLSKTECARILCTSLSLHCDSIDFNDDDDTGSAGFIEKILNNI